MIGHASCVRRRSAHFPGSFGSSSTAQHGTAHATPTCSSRSSGWRQSISNLRVTDAISYSVSMSRIHEVFRRSQTIGCVGWLVPRRGAIGPWSPNRRQGQAFACPCRPIDRVPPTTRSLWLPAYRLASGRSAAWKGLISNWNRSWLTAGSLSTSFSACAASSALSIKTAPERSGYGPPSNVAPVSKRLTMYFLCAWRWTACGDAASEGQFGPRRRSTA